MNNHGKQAQSLTRIEPRGLLRNPAVWAAGHGGVCKRQGRRTPRAFTLGETSHHTQRCPAATASRADDAATSGGGEPEPVCGGGGARCPVPWGTDQVRRGGLWGVPVQGAGRRARARGRCRASAGHG